MLKIEQGSNSPIKLDFDESYEDATALSAMLYGTSQLKHWTKEDAQWEGTTCYLPLTEAETLAMQSGAAVLTVKFLDAEGNIIFSEKEAARIIYEPDKTRLIGD